VTFCADFSIDISRECSLNTYINPVANEMDIPIHDEGPSLRRLTAFAAVRSPIFVAYIFAGLVALQALSFLVLGTGQAGKSVSLLTLVAHNLLALACAWFAFRRARSVAALFWLLYFVSLLALLIPTAFGAYDTVFGRSSLSDSTWRVLFCLYGAPILMMLFLPEVDRERLKSEIFLDLFQVAIVVGLTFFTFFLIPARQMLPGEALLRNISLSNVESIFLIAALFVRLLFAGGPGTRNLLLRLGVFLLFCAVVTYVGNWIDLHHYESASIWFGLGWGLPYVAGGLVALTWRAPAAASSTQAPTGFGSFLGTNLLLVALLLCIDLLMGRWREAHGETLTTIAVAASLLAFTIRLALTQYYQQQEIAQRKAAQDELSAANETITGLLEDARVETSAITQISELGSLLQACSSREEAFRVIPERLARLFPGTSGAISVLNPSKDRAEPAAEWGVRLLNQTFAPDECWSLRRGCAHELPGGDTSLRCTHLQAEGSSVCIPLIANGEAIGVLSIQDGAQQSNISLLPGSDGFGRRKQLASAVAEHIALAISNLNLREALRLQAIHDSLTGLYNRRYMQEFLERELYRARRRNRPLAVMMLDLDNFKRYNDSFGHPAGDEALRFVGDVLLRAVRADDLACRYGGEEFSLILPECSLQQAAARAEEIRARLKDLHMQRSSELPGTITVSIGVAAFEETTDKGNLLLKFADDALYQAKRAGRDRVVVARPATNAAQLAATPTGQP
jgi:diguanylate cyclase (GGDEF)-like protein